MELEMKKIILAILLIVFPLSSFAAKRALLVGINDYQRLPCTLPGRGLISDLRGSLNDVRIVRNILISRYGFSPNEIKCLTERNARREDILKAFNEWLINGSREGDLVLFYFSGHGARVKDKNGDERDKYD
ncbi:MAG TPA: caspase family protein, partial [Candidatus Desulfofervidus auxilii]|nr:caspase family protein [Candidatus Desulfofervidus auxilii]